MNKRIETFLMTITLLLLGQLFIQIINYSKPTRQSQVVTSATDTVGAKDPIRSIPEMPKTSISFKEINHDFGTINDSKKVYTTFQFTNKGAEPLMIFSAEGSCGCTVPTWPKEPIAPGQNGTIEVAFDPTSKLGEHRKTIVITANTEPTTTLLTIQANIVKSL